MKSSLRYAIVIFSSAVLVFGLGCLNYTKIGQIERHTEFAQRNALPAPSLGLAHLGMVLTPLSAGLIGYAIGRRVKPCPPNRPPVG